MSLLFKPLSLEHIPLLHQWMHEPHIKSKWYTGKEWSLEELIKKYTPYTLGYTLEQGERKAISPFIIFKQKQPIGYIQMYNAFDFSREEFKVEEAWLDRSKPLAAIDFYIGDPEYTQVGIGADLLREFLLQHVFSNFAACLVDTEKSNKIEIQTFAKAGFSTVLELPSSVVMIAEKNPKINPIIIFGSARSDGYTLEAIQSFIGNRSIPLVDLRKLDIAHYDYQYENSNDDFIPLAETMIRHNPIILATPVYWYSMSAIMKIFIDRWSDLLDIRKDIGRRLANKELYIIASYGESLPKGFEETFSQTCEYLNMQYKGCFYFYSGSDPDGIKKNKEAVKKFSELIFEKENYTGDISKQ